MECDVMGWDGIGKDRITSDGESLLTFFIMKLN